MATYEVRGGMSGRLSETADDIILSERFSERFADLDTALSRARELAATLHPNGRVVVWDIDTRDASNPMDLGLGGFVLRAECGEDGSLTWEGNSEVPGAVQR